MIYSDLRQLKCEGEVPLLMSSLLGSPPTPLWFPLSWEFNPGLHVCPASALSLSSVSRHHHLSLSFFILTEF